MLQIQRFRLAVLTVSALSLIPAAMAQSKIAVVNTQAAILDTAQIEKAQKEMEAQFQPRQDALQKLQRELQDIQDQLQKMQGKLTPDAERDLQIRGQRTQRDLQRQSEDLQADVENHRNDILGRVSQQMQAVIQKLAEERGYDLVVDVTNTLYFKAALDITADATAAYNAAYPAP